MRQVAVAGVGKTAFGVFANRDLRSLAVEASRKCLENSGVADGDVQAFYLGNFAGPSFAGQSHLAPFVAAEVGLSGIPATRFEDACASGGTAFFHAWAAVASGIYDTVLVTGVEKMTSQSGPRVTEILASAGDVSGEMRAGATFPALFAMIARRHMYEFGTTREQMAAVAVKNHANGAMNPDAHLRKVITLEQALAGRPVADPLTLFDCSPVSDGAASVLLMAAEKVPEPRVVVRGIAQTSDHVALDRKETITTFKAVQQAGEKAYRMAGLSPSDIDFAEVHDCFTIAEIIAIEDLGFVAKGAGGAYSAAGHTSLRGEKPINPSGGLKSKGHPVGATGIAQICDAVQQIRGNAGDRQLARHAIGLTQNLGGSGATCVVTILGEG